uniref:Carboxypeptidase inhibitor n=1 Tax=Rhipicephalus zambeziensis TaxID=60191 RepID=A0A224YBN5_9ACAR
MTPGAVASTASSSVPAAGTHQYGNPAFQGASTPPVVTVVPAPVSPGHTVIVSQPGYGQQPGIPPYNSSLWANQACKYYGLMCVSLESCSRKLRLPLTGCGHNDVCCNMKKTKDCHKVGGECRMSCKKHHAVPYHYAKCALGFLKCCIYMPKKKA